MTSSLFFEDFAAGQRYDLGSFALSQDEIVEFARRFDPQPFHTDPEEAARSPFGGIIASGWHSAASAMRLMVDSFIPRESSMGSSGIDELRWRKPVRPDTEIRVSYTVEAVTASTTRADRGYVRGYLEAVDPDGDVVMTFRGTGIYRRRPV